MRCIAQVWALGTRRPAVGANGRDDLRVVRLIVLIILAPDKPIGIQHVALPVPEKCARSQVRWRLTTRRD